MTNGSRQQARIELEKTLEEYSQLEDKYTEDGGKITQEIGTLDIFMILKRMERINVIHAKFLLYLDDKMLEFNIVKHDFEKLENEFRELVNNRSKFCPVIGRVVNVEGRLTKHLREVERQEIRDETTANLKAKWIKEGKEDERESFKKAATIISLVFGAISLAFAIITYLLGIWRF